MIGRFFVLLVAAVVVTGCSSIDLIAHGIKSWDSDDKPAKSAPKDEAPPAIAPTKDQAAQRDVIRGEELPPP